MERMPQPRRRPHGRPTGLWHCMRWSHRRGAPVPGRGVTRALAGHAGHAQPAHDGHRHVRCATVWFALHAGHHERLALDAGLALRARPAAAAAPAHAAREPAMVRNHGQRSHGRGDARAAARSFPRRSRGAGGALLHVRGRQARRRPAAVHPVRLLLPVKLHVLLRLVPLQPARPRRCPLRLRQAGHVALAERLVVARRAQGYVYHDGGDGVAAGLGN
mmetsp:Transcript_33668/g.108748  ORF Transcript_33668/g.108748 Transcript_33668/m.108748 type:complete len:218 (+) Transcript_33668:732-1385(+)